MRKILLVEDEKMIRYGIYVMIENSGVPYQEIIECRNGKDAIACLEKDKYDLVLTDIKMPLVSGIELTKWIYANIEAEYRPLIVAISGYAEFEYVREMLKHNAMDYILKPVDRDELTKVLWQAEKKYRERGNIDIADEKNIENTLTSTSKRKMQQAVDFVYQNYARPIDMAEVSNHVSMNYSMFSAIFKEYTGENFNSFLKTIRVEKGKKLLDNTDMNIKEIAEKVGFEDARYFGKVFKERMGCTPMAYRDKK